MASANALAAQQPPLPGVVTLPLSEGDAGTAETVQQMCRLIEEGSRDPLVNRTAIAILQAAKVPQFDFEGERRALYEWLRRSIRFVRDIEGKETLRSPRETLTVGAGDCDCNTILTLALLKTIGQRVRIITIAAHPEAPDIFSHVFGEVRDERGRWIPMDSARRKPGYGRGPSGAFRVYAWDPEDGSCEDVTQSYPFDRNGRGGGRGSLFAGLGFLGAPPAARTATATPRASRQMLSLRAAARRRKANLRGLSLGQDSSSGFDWSQLPGDISAAAGATSSIITAERGNPNITAISMLTPAAQAAALQSELGVSSLSLGAIPSWMWLVGAAVLAIAVWPKGRER